MNKIPAIGTPVRTQAIINQYGLWASKRLGQNFLIDLNVLQKIVEQAKVTDRDIVVEIGPGIGALTEQLALHAKEVFAYEIDKKLIPVLHDTLSGFSNIEIIFQDILKADFAELKGHQPVKVVANLPYYITTPILFALLKSRLDFTSFTVMMQKEVARRIQAGPGSKDYGELSLAVQYYLDVDGIFDVDRRSFLPQPGVDSSVISLVKKRNFKPFVFQEQLFKVIKAGFAHRRKSLINNLLFLVKKSPEKRQQLENILTAIDLPLNIRGEKLDLNKYEQLTSSLIEKGFIS
ncbi:16S rRNA (adenine(1518)-N(6)/adenine(1519)-N(6))-dimethyltransferase RsmA [Oenococcus alcoholitolerans]|uniref:16S rRNA (adenine(1518)-N(6)/adenine(1519)-N(6))- dimethyltransferase RsmA n=1 Tax=Oenococcus alcoholitolerans TaxID=931074 RepID=UPI003F6EFAFB